MYCMHLHVCGYHRSIFMNSLLIIKAPPISMPTAYPPPKHSLCSWAWTVHIYSGTSELQTPRDHAKLSAWAVHIYSGTSELWTPQDHAKLGGVLYTEGVPVNVTTLSSCCTPRVQKLSMQEHFLVAERPWNVEEWIETTEVFKNSKLFYSSWLRLVWSQTLPFQQYKYTEGGREGGRRGKGLGKWSTLLCCAGI